MHFCVNCSNMYYIRLSEEDPNSIVYYCRNCGHENKNITLDSVTISRTNFKSSKQKYNSIINKYTKMDPTLPRINTIKCPNQACKSNEGHGQAQEFLRQQNQSQVRVQKVALANLRLVQMSHLLKNPKQ